MMASLPHATAIGNIGNPMPGRSWSGENRDLVDFEGTQLFCCGG